MLLGSIPAKNTQTLYDSNAGSLSTVSAAETASRHTTPQRGRILAANGDPTCVGIRRTTEALFDVSVLTTGPSIPLIESCMYGEL
jgi:hypothetical protein